VDGRDRCPAAAWLLALLLLPGAGIGLYLLVGEPRLARRLRRRSVAATGLLGRKAQTACAAAAILPEAIPERFRAPSASARRSPRRRWWAATAPASPPISNAAIAALVEAMDGARSTDPSLLLHLADRCQRG